jgi:hypothetical protein
MSGAQQEVDQINEESRAALRDMEGGPAAHELWILRAPRLVALFLDRLDTLNHRLSDMKSGLDGIDDKLTAIEMSVRGGNQ